MNRPLTPNDDEKTNLNKTKYRNQINKVANAIRGIAGELRVSAIPEGSVLKNGNNIRITAQLIDAESDTHIWSGKFDMDFSEIFSIYSEVAKAWSGEMKVLITPDALLKIEKRTTSDILAYEAYLMGRYHGKNLNKKDLEIAMQFFNLAKERDTGFALAKALSLDTTC